ncbi:MAG: CHASE domain-containing protein [Patescibacteria group bacterium]|jgi:PAS domain S-box-containing protein
MKYKTLRSHVLPIFIFIIGLSLSLAAFFYMSNILKHQAQLKFETQVQDVTGLIGAMINRDIYVLNGLKGLFVASQSVERNEFYDYLDQLDLAQNYPGINTINYWEKVKLEDTDKFIEQVRQDKSVELNGYPNFTIYPTSTAVESFIIKYIYPEKGLENILGFDVYSEMNRKQPAELARNSGQITVTNRISLLPDNSPGILLLAPIYRNGATIISETDRRVNTVGFVSVTIIANDFFSNILSRINLDWHQFDLSVYDSIDGNYNKEMLYYDSDVRNNDFQQSGFIKEVPFSVADHIWVLRYWGLDNYGLTWGEMILPWLFLFFGVLISFLAAVVVYFLANSQIKATELAETITMDLRESEEKFKAIAQAIQDAIIMMDDKGLVVFWNQAAERILGYSSAEIMGKYFHKIVATEKGHQTKKNNILQFGKTGESNVIGSLLELSVKKKNGELITVELSVARVKIKGKWHAVGVMRDITEKKKVTDALASRSEELERINKLMIGREMKMIELKKRIEDLKKTEKNI